MRALLTAAVAAALLLGAASGASAKTTWPCQPGLRHDPCTPGLKTTRVDATGATLGTLVEDVTRQAKRYLARHR